MASGDPIDPRYAAQFQRGYDATGEDAGSPRPQQAALRVLSVTPPSAPRVPPPPSLVERPAVPVVPTLADAPASLAATGEADEAPPTPWIEWALLGFGVLLLAAAAWIFWEAAHDVVFYVGGAQNGELAALTIRNQLPGPLLVAGVLALSCWVVLRAIRPAVPR